VTAEMEKEIKFLVDNYWSLNLDSPS